MLYTYTYDPEGKETMPRGVSRSKHPELYGGSSKTSSKAVGTSRRGTRRVKTGGRTNNLQSSGSSDLERLQVLANIRSAISSDRASNTANIIGKVDQILNFELDGLIETISENQNEDNDERSDAAVVERPSSTPAFNPPGPAPTPGTYATPTRS